MLFCLSCMENLYDAFICLQSIRIPTVITCRSVLQEYTAFFSIHYGKRVSFSDRMEFINGWYFLIIISDVLTISGSLLKIIIQLKVRVKSVDNCCVKVWNITVLSYY